MNRTMNKKLTDELRNRLKDAYCTISSLTKEYHRLLYRLSDLYPYSLNCFTKNLEEYFQDREAYVEHCPKAEQEYCVLLYGLMAYQANMLDDSSPYLESLNLDELDDEALIALMYRLKFYLDDSFEEPLETLMDFKHLHDAYHLLSKDLPLYSYDAEDYEIKKDDKTVAHYDFLLKKIFTTHSNLTKVDIFFFKYYLEPIINFFHLYESTAYKMESLFTLFHELGARID